MSVPAAAQSCPICGSGELIEHAGRPAALCVSCGALERHRALARSQAHVLEHGGDRGALEIGPLNERVFGEFLGGRGWRYTCVDQSRRGNARDPRAVGFIDFEADAQDLSAFAEDSLALVMAQHVIEEIEDYEAALAEIARVLGPGGSALLEIPFDPGRARSARQEADGFGNVWRFGADLPAVVRGHFDTLEVVALAEGGYHGHLLVAGNL
jgi:SAM-dependent methyltransferase